MCVGMLDQSHTWSTAATGRPLCALCPISLGRFGDGPEEVCSGELCISRAGSRRRSARAKSTRRCRDGQQTGFAALAAVCVVGICGRTKGPAGPGPGPRGETRLPRAMLGNCILVLYGFTSVTRPGTRDRGRCVCARAKV